MPPATATRHRKVERGGREYLPISGGVRLAGAPPNRLLSRMLFCSSSPFPMSSSLQRTLLQGRRWCDRKPQEALKIVPTCRHNPVLPRRVTRQAATVSMRSRRRAFYRTGSIPRNEPSVVHPEKEREKHETLRSRSKSLPVPEPASATSSGVSLCEASQVLFRRMIVLRAGCLKSDRTVRLTTFEVRRIVLISRVAAKLERSTRRLWGTLTPTQDWGLGSSGTESTVKDSILGPLE
jgi:hypothetical protein